MTDDFNRIGTAADALGHQIAAHPAFTAFKEAHERLRKDPAARKLLDEQQAALERVQLLEAEGKPVEPADKRALREAQERLHADPLLQEFARTQADYISLMNRVTAGIHTPIHLEPLFGEEEPGT
ncbi:MAG: YlbF family regulator [Planctomycetota bacterium]